MTASAIRRAELQRREAKDVRDRKLIVLIRDAILGNLSIPREVAILVTIRIIEVLDDEGMLA